MFRLIEPRPFVVCVISDCLGACGVILEGATGSRLSFLLFVTIITIIHLFHEAILASKIANPDPKLSGHALCLPTSSCLESQLVCNC